MRRYVFRLAILSLAVLGTSAVQADDQQIAQQIIEKLQAEKKAGALKGFSIDLQVDEGTVWLSGRVANEQQQSRALDLARRVGGVKQVVNDLAINEPASRPLAAMQPAPAPANQSAPPTIEAIPIRAEPLAVATPTPANSPATAGEPSPIIQAPAPNQSTLANLVAAGPAASNASAKSTVTERKPPSPAQNSMLNSVSKTLMSAVHGGRQVEERQASPVQHASGNQDLAVLSPSGPIGSGLEPTAASSRRSVVQAAQPVPNVPQQVATADSLQPITPVAPQVTAMVPMQVPYMTPVYAGSQMQVPLAMGPARTVNYVGGPVPNGATGAPVPMYMPGSGVGIAPARYDHPTMPGYAWPSYAACPNYAAVTYPKQYSPTAWPYIGPFYPYPQVPLGWRKVTLEWDDGWWMLDFKDRRTMYNH